MARPQYAIAQSGSACAMAANALADARYQNECRSATARSNGFCTDALHETGNRTCPIFSVSSAATAAPTTAAITKATSGALLVMVCVSSTVFFGLPDHRRMIEAVDLVDQLVGEHLVDVHGALDELLLPIERVEPSPLRG